MELNIDKTWTQLNNKLSTDKFGAVVRHGAKAEITYDPAPTSATKGKLFNLGDTIKVDPTKVLYVRSTGVTDTTLLVLDENFI